MRKTSNRDANAALSILCVFAVETLHGDQTELTRAALVPLGGDARVE